MEFSSRWIQRQRISVFQRSTPFLVDFLHNDLGSWHQFVGLSPPFAPTPKLINLMFFFLVLSENERDSQLSPILS